MGREGKGEGLQTRGVTDERSKMERRVKYGKRRKGGLYMGKEVELKKGLQIRREGKERRVTDGKRKKGEKVTDGKRRKGRKG